ncbi:MAG: hypothetical protein LBH70_10055 [Spirochaetaceae bacterium]|jgi:hypothetical protein|nr:hypothetical protein [Spirochaetaceae bacterium]
MVVPVILAAASLMLSGFSFLFCFAYLKRRTGRERILVELNDEIERLVRDVNEITNRDTLLVEDRVKTLKALLEDIDHRIILLAGEVSRRRTQEEVYVELGKFRSPIVESDLTASVPLPSAPVPAPAGSPSAAGTGAARPSPSQTYSPHIVHSASPIVPKPPPFAEQVAGLYLAGLSPELIAARLGAALSEVELAIALVEGRRP